LELEQVLNQNLSVLEEYHPEVASLFRTNSDPEGFEFDCSRDVPTPVYRKFDREIHFYSRYDPEKEARRRIRRYDIEDQDELINFGTNSPYLIDEIRRRMDENTTLVVVEPDPDIFRISLKACSLWNVILPDERVDLVIEGTARKLRDQLNERSLGKWCVVITSPQTSKLIPPEFSGVRDLLEDLDLQRKSASQFSNIKEKNLEKNRSMIESAVGVEQWIGTFEGGAGLLCGAGPTLETGIKNLRADPVRMELIVAVGSSLLTLETLGMRPDVIVFTDPQQKLIRQVEPLGETFKKIPLLFVPTVSPTVLEWHEGDKIVAVPAGHYRDDNWNRWAEQKGQLKTGGSVATPAFDLLLETGVGDIYMAGQDFCFPWGLSHSRGSYRYKELTGTLSRFNTIPTEMRNAIADRDSEYVRNYHGENVLTKKNLLTYKRWFERRIRQEEDRHFVSLSPYSAQLNGVHELNSI